MKHSTTFLKTARYCSLLLLLAATAFAAPVTWTLITFAPTLGMAGIGVGGTFTYNADTNQMISWDIHEGTLIDLGTLSPLYPQGPECPSCETFFSSSINGGEFLYTFGSEDVVHQMQMEEVTLALSLPLTDKGGTLALISGTSDGTGSFWAAANTVTGVLQFFPFVNGTVTAAPEPAFGYCTGLFLLWAAIFSLRKVRS